MLTIFSLAKSALRERESCFLAPFQVWIYPPLNLACHMTKHELPTSSRMRQDWLTGGEGVKMNY